MGQPSQARPSRPSKADHSGHLLFHPSPQLFFFPSGASLLSASPLPRAHTRGIHALDPQPECLSPFPDASAAMASILYASRSCASPPLCPLAACFSSPQPPTVVERRCLFPPARQHPCVVTSSPGQFPPSAPSPRNAVHRLPEPVCLPVWFHVT